MKTAYPTPGPWMAEHVKCLDHAETAFDVYGADKQFVADCGCHDQSPANAQLIAAAPDLYLALKTLYDETADYIRINSLGDVHHNHSMQIARDALAKVGNAPEQPCSGNLKCANCGRLVACDGRHNEPQYCSDKCAIREVPYGRLLNWKCKNGHPVPHMNCQYCDELGKLHDDCMLAGMIYCPSCQAYHTPGWRH